MRLSIDPGLAGTGLAWWSDEEWSLAVCPLHTMNLYADAVSLEINQARYEISKWQAKARNLCDKLELLLRTYPVKVAYCEYPEFMGSAGGHMVATKGDLNKLTFVVGLFARTCWANDVRFECYPVSEWKGQMSKEAVWGRCLKRVPELASYDPAITSHSQDAVAIGLFAKGLLHANQ